MTKRAWKCPDTGVYINASELALMKAVATGSQGNRVLSYAELQKMIGRSTSTVRNSAVSLRKKGFLSVRKRYEEGVGQLANEYSLTQAGAGLLKALSGPNEPTRRSTR